MTIMIIFISYKYKHNTFGVCSCWMLCFSQTEVVQKWWQQQGSDKLALWRGTKSTNLSFTQLHWCKALDPFHQDIVSNHFLDRQNHFIADGPQLWADIALSCREGILSRGQWGSNQKPCRTLGSTSITTSCALNSLERKCLLLLFSQDLGVVLRHAEDFSMSVGYNHSNYFLDPPRILQRC